MGIWDGAYKIPWDDPAFSRRMLAEHLAQDHDMASRRTEWIERQVEWIDRTLLAERPAAILDLGCGPGFYSNRLATRGHRCFGIDFGPASIDYARRQGTAGEFELGDIRFTPFGGPYDLAMILFGEVNVFSPAEALTILRRSAAAAGSLIVEAQTPDAVERAGRAAPVELWFESGVFSSRPYRCRTESQWLSRESVSIQTFTITEKGSEPRVYRSTTKAWSGGELTALLEAAGFDDVRRRPDWPCNTGDLALWECHSVGSKTDCNLA